MGGVQVVHPQYHQNAVPLRFRRQLPQHLGHLRPVLERDRGVSGVGAELGVRAALGLELRLEPEHVPVEAVDRGEVGHHQAYLSEFHTDLSSPAPTPDAGSRPTPLSRTAPRTRAGGSAKQG